MRCRHLISIVGLAIALGGCSAQTPVSSVPEQVGLIQQGPSGASEEAMSEGQEQTNKLPQTDAEWKKVLTPDQFYVTRKKGTERAFSGEYWNSKDKGTYVCVCCGQPLFSSETKFDSGTGWPSFWAPVDEQNVETENDYKFFMRRTEVHCSRCEAHLGHVFEDGPEPTGLRYCINSVALELKKEE